MKTLCLVLLCATLWARGDEVIGAGRPRNLAELLGSADNVAILKNATAVRVCSVKPLPARKASTEKQPDVHRSSDRGKFVALDAERIAQLKQLLLDEHAYEWTALESFCLPNYTIRAEFRVGSKLVAADFCFGCNNVLFSNSKKSLGDQDLTAGGADELFQFFRKVFPDDPVLAELARKKSRPAGRDD